MIRPITADDLVGGTESGTAGYGAAGFGTAGFGTAESGTSAVSFGTVVSVGGTGVQIRLDGETAAGEKRYKRLASYTPAGGDRVLLYRVAGSMVILGKVV